MSCRFEDDRRQHHLRIKKTEKEHYNIQQAIDLTHHVWAYLRRLLVLGMTEHELRGLLIAEALRL